MKKTFFIILFAALSLLIFSGSCILALSAQAEENQELVSNVQNFKAIPGDSHVNLSWNNLQEIDFAGVKIQRSGDSYPASPDSGDNVYQGLDNYFIDLKVINDNTYYYTIFAYDTSKNYSSGAIAMAKPFPPSLIEPYQESSPLAKWTIGTEIAPKTPQKIEKIELTHFSPYLLFEKKPLKIDFNQTKELHIVKDSFLLLEIPADIFAKEVNVITVSTGESSYLMKHLPEKNKYQIVIPAPQTKGDYELRLVIVYQDKTLADLKTKLLVDPQGYIYELSSNFLGFGKKQEMRIEGAGVKLFQKNKEGFIEWKADDYYQENPIITSQSGEYAFFVPNGEYYLEVQKKGYQSKKSDTFVVENKLVNQNIEFEPRVKPWIWAIIGVALAGVVLLVLLFVRRKIHKRDG